MLKDNFGKKAIDIAKEKDQLEIVKLLEEKKSQSENAAGNSWKTYALGTFSAVFVGVVWYFYITSQREEKDGREVDDRQRSDSPDGQEQEPSKSNRNRKKAKAAKRAKAEAEAVKRAEAAQSAGSSQNSVNPPDGFVCSISQDIMEDPVVAADGFTYERKQIEAWLEGHNTSPQTGAALEHKELVPNYNLRALILDWKSAHSKNLRS